MQTFIQSANNLRFSDCDRELQHGGGAVMGTHIIWRNPSPPRTVEFKLRRVMVSPYVSVYCVASPNYQHPFELIRRVGSPGSVRQPKAQSAIALAELMTVRW